MEALVLLALLVFAGWASWTGHVVDSRDPEYTWNPRRGTGRRLVTHNRTYN